MIFVVVLEQQPIRTLYVIYPVFWLFYGRMISVHVIWIVLHKIIFLIVKVGLVPINMYMNTVAHI